MEASGGAEGEHRCMPKLFKLKLLSFPFPPNETKAPHFGTHPATQGPSPAHTMSSALLNFARRAAAQAPARVAARRGVSTSAPKLGGADEPAYIHAEKMYDVGATKGRTLVFGTATAAIVLIGGGIPVYACHFQNRKASG